MRLTHLGCSIDTPTQDSAAFVRDVFNAIKYKTYLPIGSSRKSFHPSNAPNLPVTLPAPVHSGEISLGGAPSGPLRDNKKRSYHDRADSPELRDYQSGADASGRSFKQLRRGGNAGRGGRFEDFGNFRGGMQNQQPSMSPSGLLPFPEAPPGLPPFDPNNPMAAFLAMQQMGFTLPGMPPLPEEGRAPAGRQPHQKRNQRCRDYDTKGFCARGASCKFEHGGDSIYVPPTALPTDEYDPTNASLMPGLEGPAMPNSTSQTPYVPQNGYTNDSGRGRGRGRGGIRGDRGGARGGRAEFSSDRANNDKSKTTIVVENIPEEKFTEEAVREFFSEFGEMVNIELRPYRHLAIIKYKEWAEANAAYRSPKVIFDNRFVKVYWYTDDSRLPQPPAGANASHTNGSHKIQGDDQEMSNATGAFTRATSEPKIDLEELARRQAEAQKLYEEKMKKKAEVEAKAKELEARQEELLKKQAEEKRKLMEKLAAKTKAAGGAGEGPEVTEEKKPMSQAEALKAQLAALEAEAKALGIDPAAATGQEDSWGGGYRGRGRGRGFYGAPRGTFPPRGAYRGRGGRGGAAPFAAVTSQYRLDNRPKKVALTGVDFTDLERDEALRHHLLVSFPPPFLASFLLPFTLLERKRD